MRTKLICTIIARFGKSRTKTCFETIFSPDTIEKHSSTGIWRARIERTFTFSEETFGDGATSLSANVTVLRLVEAINSGLFGLTPAVAR